MDERRPPAVEEAPRPLAPGADPRALYFVIAVLLGVIVLLVVQPWTGSPSSGPTGRVDPGDPPATSGAPGGDLPGATSSSEPAPIDPYAQLWVTCGSPSGWRVATLQEWEDRVTPIRSWMAIDPVDASGPLDPRIPFAPVATDVVTAIGYCSPLDELQRPPEAAVASLWAVRDAAAIPLTAARLEPADPNALGGLWLPAPEISSADAGSHAWPPGRYAIEVASPGGTYDRWLGLEIEDLRALHSPGAGSPEPASPEASSGVP